MMMKIWTKLRIAWGTGYFWSPVLDVYWGDGCKEVFHRTWLISTPPASVSWDGKIHFERNEGV